MTRVEIVRSLVLEIQKRFSRAEANEILDLIGTLEKSPRKGKPLGTVGAILIKELKYKQYRFYFLTNGHTLKLIDEEALVGLLLRVVRMSDKKHQQQTISEIKVVLQTIGPMGFKQE